jgi:murein DD-endopeptidase MepM/ murein hydrolase activator NlpD
MKKNSIYNFFANILIITSFIIGLTQPAFALSSQKGSDPTGKSQRQIIENTPWFDPTECAAPIKTSGTFSTIDEKQAFDKIQEFLKDKNLLSSQAKAYVDAGKKEDVDPYLLVAISMLETGNGTSDVLKTKNNAAGIYDQAAQDSKSFAKIEDSIFEQANILNRFYIQEGLITIPDIGAKYAPPGASNDPNGTNGEWPANVKAIYGEMTGISDGSLFNQGRFTSNTNTTNPATGAINPSTGNSSGGKLYLIGDSITADTAINNELKKQLGTLGYNPVEINSVASRRISSGGSNLDGISAFLFDRNKWKDANTIIIELGTNGGLNVKNITEIMSNIKEANPNAKVYWVNVGVNNATRDAGDINTDELDKVLKDNESLGYKVIDWNTVAKTNPSLIFNDGLGVHPYTTEGRKAYIDTIIKGLGDQPKIEQSQNGCLCPAGVINNGFQGGDLVETAFNFFNGREGIDAIHAAAIVGNFMLESGGNTTIDPNITNSIGAFGIAQWLGGRKEGLINFARKQGKQPNDLQVQLEYTIYEVQNSEKGGFQKFLQTTNVRDAAISWEDNFERSGGAGITQRVNNSEKVFQLYGKNAPSSTSGASVNSGSPSDCNNLPGAIGQAPNGFVFPLLTTKSQILKGNSAGLKWCTTSQVSCHGVYPAADIGVPEGTVVVASASGKVVRAEPGCSQNCGIQIKGDDQYLYYYTHLGGGTVKVKTGDTVKAGQELGKVGSAADAENTSPHLHFDIFNKSYDRHPACSRENGCPAQVGMIDPQPWLVSAYNNLPE